MVTGWEEKAAVWRERDQQNKLMLVGPATDRLLLRGALRHLTLNVSAKAYAERQRDCHCEAHCAEAIS